MIRRKTMYLVRDFSKGRIEELQYTRWNEFVEIVQVLLSAKRDFETFAVRGGMIREKIVPTVSDNKLSFQFDSL